MAPSQVFVQNWIGLDIGQTIIWGIMDRNKEIKLSVPEVNSLDYLKNPNWKIISTNDKSSQKAAGYNTNLQNERRKLSHPIVNYVKKLYYWCKKKQVV